MNAVVKCNYNRHMTLFTCAAGDDGVLKTKNDDDTVLNCVVSQTTTRRLSRGQYHPPSCQLNSFTADHL